MEGSTAEEGADTFHYSGEIWGIRLEGGPSRIFVNSTEINPKWYRA